MTQSGVCGKIKQRKIREPINDTKEDSKKKIGSVAKVWKYKFLGKKNF